MSDVNIEGAFFPLIPQPKDLKLVPLVSYLKDRETHSKALLDCIVYSMLTPPPRRYYYNFVKRMKPSMKLEGKALVRGRTILLIDYIDMYGDPHLCKVKDEILYLLNSYVWG